MDDQFGTRGGLAGIWARFTENLIGQLSVNYGTDADVEFPWSASAGISWKF